MDSNEVDIGFVPKLRVVSTQPSFAWEPDTERPVVDIPFNATGIIWDDEISHEEAKVILERTFYPFKKVEFSESTRVWFTWTFNYFCGLLL